MASIDSDEVITAENAEEKCKDNDLMIDLNTNLLQKYRRIKGTLRAVHLKNPYNFVRKFVICSLEFNEFSLFS